MSGRVFTVALATALAAGAQQIPVEGRADSPVRVLIFEDLQCPDCAELRKMLDEKLLPKYADSVAFVHRDFPLAKHAWARQAAVASRFFAGVKPELGVEFRRETVTHIPEVNKAGFEAHLKEFAMKHGVDAAAAMASLQEEQLGALVEKDFQEGVARGVAKTPTAFVNGKPFIETFTFEEISAAIDQALAGSR